MAQIDADNVRRLWMSLEQACAYFGCSRRTLYRRVKAGAVELKRRGKRSYFRDKNPAKASVPSPNGTRATGTLEVGDGKRATCQALARLDEPKPTPTPPKNNLEGKLLQELMSLSGQLSQSELERGQLLERNTHLANEAGRLQHLAHRQDNHMRQLQSLVNAQDTAIQELITMVKTLWPEFELGEMKAQNHEQEGI